MIHRKAGDGRKKREKKPEFCLGLAGDSCCFKLPSQVSAIQGETGHDGGAMAGR